MKKMLVSLLLWTGVLITLQAVSPPVSLKVESQNRSPELYSWADRHKAILQRNKTLSPEYVIFGDSITHFWGGEPADKLSVRSPDSWNTLFGSHRVTNMGFGYDYIDNAYYRVVHGELDDLEPRIIIILLGTNNIGHRRDTAQMSADNMGAFLELIKEKCPRSKILLLGVLPRIDCDFVQPVIKEANKLYNKLADNKTVFFANPGAALIERKTGKAKKEYLPDGIHPNSDGYKLLGKELQKKLSELDPQYTPKI